MTEAKDRTCGTCRHWDEDVLNANPEQRWGSCTFILGPQALRGDEGSDRASVSDFSGYVASLNTREDFGCIEWGER